MFTKVGILKCKHFATDNERGINLKKLSMKTLDIICISIGYIGCVINFVIDVRQVSDFLKKFQFQVPINQTDTTSLTYC